jgi:hypothetical protein
MKYIIRNSLLCAALLAAVPAFAQETAAPKEKPMGRTETQHTSLSAEVVAIDQAKREITLKGPEGNTVTLAVGEAVKRLDEVKVGDYVRADYLVSVAVEVRKPTPEEAKNPLVILDAEGRAAKDVDPAGGAARCFKVVTTIEALNRINNTVTVKGPLGNYLTAQVADPERLTKVHIGETIVIVYTEGVTISLEKAEKKTAN